MRPATRLQWWHRLALTCLGHAGIAEPHQCRRFWKANPDSELYAMCNRYQPGDRQVFLDLFNARELRQFNAGPDTVHPKDPGWVVRVVDREMVLEPHQWQQWLTLDLTALFQFDQPFPAKQMAVDATEQLWAKPLPLINESGLAQ